jgi:hypothetical protein
MGVYCSFSVKKTPGSARGGKESGIDNLPRNRMVMVTKHHYLNPRRLRTSEK